MNTGLGGFFKGFIDNIVGAISPAPEFPPVGPPDNPPFPIDEATPEQPSVEETKVKHEVKTGEKRLSTEQRKHQIEQEFKVLETLDQQLKVTNNITKLIDKQLEEIDKLRNQEEGKIDLEKFQKKDKEFRKNVDSELKKVVKDEDKTLNLFNKKLHDTDPHHFTNMIGGELDKIKELIEKAERGEEVDLAEVQKKNDEFKKKFNSELHQAVGKMDGQPEKRLGEMGKDEFWDAIKAKNEKEGVNKKGDKKGRLQNILENTENIDKQTVEFEKKSEELATKRKKEKEGLKKMVTDVVDGIQNGANKLADKIKKDINKL